jgi:hypothetical protein
MGNPINNDDISLAEVRPKLLPEAGNNLGTKLVIVVCHSDPRGFRRRSAWGHDKIGAMAYAKLDETVNMRFQGDPRFMRRGQRMTFPLSRV